MTGRPRGKPTEPGNVLALRHGAHSPRVVTATAATKRAEVIAAADWLDRPEFALVVAALARTEAQIDLVADYLDRNGGPLLDDGSVRPSADYLLKLERSAGALRERLGMDPVSYVKLRRDLAAVEHADTYAETLEEGRRLREQALAALDPQETPETSVVDVESDGTEDPTDPQSEAP